MRQTIPGILSRHKGKPAVVLGHGPSLNDVKPKLASLAKTHVLLGCNNWFVFYDVAPHYWVLASPVDSLALHYGRMEQLKIPVFYADVADVDGAKYANMLKSEVLAYDERHAGGQDCVHGHRRCCDFRVVGRLTVQEELQKFCQASDKFIGGYTVTEYMLAFAILMECNPIYLSGLDFDYTRGYASTMSGVPHPVIVDPSWPRHGGPENLGWTELSQDFTIMVKSAQNRGIEVINLNKSSRLETVPKGDFK